MLIKQTYVFLSHSHIDHILLTGVFDKAEFILYRRNNERIKYLYYICKI